jgi:hypothetical protein
MLDNGEATVQVEVEAKPNPLEYTNRAHELIFRRELKRVRSSLRDIIYRDGETVYVYRPVDLVDFAKRLRDAGLKECQTTYNIITFLASHPKASIKIVY